MGSMSRLPSDMMMQCQTVGDLGVSAAWGKLCRANSLCRMLRRCSGGAEGKPLSWLARLRSAWKMSEEVNGLEERSFTYDDRCTCPPRPQAGLIPPDGMIEG